MVSSKYPELGYAKSKEDTIPMVLTIALGIILAIILLPLLGPLLGIAIVVALVVGLIVTIMLAGEGIHNRANRTEEEKARDKAEKEENREKFKKYWKEDSSYRAACIVAICLVIITVAINILGSAG